MVENSISVLCGTCNSFQTVHSILTDDTRDNLEATDTEYVNISEA